MSKLDDMMQTELAELTNVLQNVMTFPVEQQQTFEGPRGYSGPSYRFTHRRYEKEATSLSDAMTEDKQYYFNIEPTENPYISAWTQVNLEDVGANFVIHKSHGWGIENLITIVDKIHYVINHDVVKSMLASYKEKLTTDKKQKKIEDVNLTGTNGTSSGYAFHNAIKTYLHIEGLSLSKDNQIILKRERKPAKPNKKKNPTLSEVKDHFDWLFNYYFYSKLNIDIKVKLKTHNLYATLKYLKEITKLSYEDLFISNGYLDKDPYFKKVWNNLDLIKPKPPKEKKND